MRNIFLVRGAHREPKPKLGKPSMDSVPREIVVSDAT
jgi:hypothetical protein